MDLLGTSLLADMEGWTPIDKNTRLIRLDGPWLWNRLSWLSLAVGAQLFTYVRFGMDHPISGRTWRLFRGRSLPAPPAPQVSPPGDQDASLIAVRDRPRYFGFGTQLRQAIAIGGNSFWSIAKSWSGLTLVALLALGTGLFAPEYMTWFGVPLLARTQEVLPILAPPLSSLTTPWILIPLLIVFYAGELLWREREAGLQALFATTPVPDWVQFVGKFGGLALMITVWVSLLMLAGLINQVVMGYHQFEIGVYLQTLFGIQLTNYLLFAGLVFAIQVIVYQKYLGYLVAMSAYGIILFASRIGVEHKLLIYAADTGWSYSDMNGFGPFIKPWLWFKLYWGSWSLLLAVVATLVWGRSHDRRINARLHLAQRRFPRYKTALLIALGLVASSGGFIFYNTNVLNEYVNEAHQKRMRADYERRYGHYARATCPVLTRTQLQVEIYPDQGAADLRATYSLVNRSTLAIDSIHLSLVPNVVISAISVDRPASTVVLDEKLGYRIYALKKPLQPGELMRLRFRLQIKSHSFTNNGVDDAVVANGSHIDSNEWMPVIGYDDDRQLHHAQDRERYGLAPRPERPSLYDSRARYQTRHAERMDFEAIVGTVKDQIAVAPGALRRRWRKGDRQYFHYQTNAPIINEYAFFSARYAVREAQWVAPMPGAQPVTIQIIYHPAHQANVTRMMKSAQASLSYYTREFGPYPYAHFRVLERPGPGRGMHAEPMTIDYQEGYSLMNPQPGGLDLPYHIMAHEVAHQWWGITFAAAGVEGAGVLIESLATYSAMQVVEQTLGYGHLMRYLTQMRAEYEVPRSRAAPPLLRANNRFMTYRKGPFALFALRNYVGQDRVNDALRELLRKYSPNPPLPTTLDLYRELQAVTPDSLQYLVHDLFAANTFWDLKTQEAVARQTPTGAWQVTLIVNARKVVVDSLGRERYLPMNEWVEIGVVTPAGPGEPSAKPLYLQKHRIRSGRQRIRVILAGQPVAGVALQAGIDPHHLLIDPDMDDNVKGVKKQSVGRRRVR
ncbi:hypothetical protein [Spirosoma sp. KNUC1025]|uniref:ABC transporter permease/M1 family aminopeptidase n=1 Tax=Spirosoma sp. KNUC1025 TaxID=2894082 RepID=UPI001E60C62E|nr:hypothetical protein [Spirosoma sp. KNUC1025]UFH57608.1 hypothetical protein LN737_30440 [Spirosoma sp. KNUC1025]